MCHILYIPLSVDGQAFDYFHLLASMLLWTFMEPVFVWEYLLSVLLGMFLGVAFLGHMVILLIWETAKLMASFNLSSTGSAICGSLISNHITSQKCLPFASPGATWPLGCSSGWLSGCFTCGWLAALSKSSRCPLFPLPPKWGRTVGTNALTECSKHLVRYT